MLKIFFKKFNLNRWFIYFSIIILILSYKTFFSEYDKPNKLIWDETYHIASGYKYLNEVMFMEPHPPLGKQLIALGEYVLNMNSNLDTKSFVSTDKVKNIPKGYSFLGVRLFPTLLAMFSSLVFFIILFLISKNVVLSFVFTLPFVFENAYITHARTAMLESSQIFFILSSFALFVWMIKLKNKTTLKNIFFLSFLIGLAVAIKISSLICLLLVLFLIAKDFFSYNMFLTFKDSMKILFKYLTVPLVVLAVLISSFYIHCTMNMNFKKKWYGASKEYKSIIKDQKEIDIKSFGIMLVDNFKYMKKYQEGVPERKLYSSSENGSHPLLWPFGFKSISYRWDRVNGFTSYVYLIGNPLVWFLGLLGVIFGIVLVLSHYIFGLKIIKKKYFYFIQYFIFIYFSYLLSMSMINRVMYLYHYFIPLFISLFIAFCIFMYLFENIYKYRKKIILVSLIIFSIDIYIVYNFFSPLSYHQPISNYQLQSRAWFKYWRLKNAQ